MKRSLPGLLLAGVIFLCGCSKTLYTHQQVLQSLHTKGDVLKKFGEPDEKIPGDFMEVWAYNWDTISKRVIPDSLGQKHPANYTNYIRFSFDTLGNVTGYKSNGVDLTYKKRDNFGKSLVNGLEVTGALVLIAAYVAIEDGYIDF